MLLEHKGDTAYSSYNHIHIHFIVVAEYISQNSDKIKSPQFFFWPLP